MRQVFYHCGIAAGQVVTKLFAQIILILIKCLNLEKNASWIFVGSLVEMLHMKRLLPNQQRLNKCKNAC
jgi:hypothetical protein